jgi:hypothetical protein
MTTIRITGVLTEDRQLIVKVPDEVPSGTVQVVFELPEVMRKTTAAVERARAKLAAAGALSSAWKAPHDMTMPSDDEPLVDIPPGPSIDEIIDEDRNER